MTAEAKSRRPSKPAERLKTRREFLEVAGGRKCATPGLVLQARRREEEGAPRVGFTVTRKVGTAVVRNRVRRRLREAARAVLPGRARAGFDYVIIGRAATAERAYDDLLADLARALEKVHRGAGGRAGKRNRKVAGNG